jgi:papain like protease
MWHDYSGDPYALTKNIVLPWHQHRQKCFQNNQKRVLWTVPPKPFGAAPAPASYTFRPYCDDVYDQMQEGSCTANAGSSYLRMNKLMPDPSRAQMYYSTLKKESPNGVIADVGAIESDIPWSTTGVCEEYLDPYTGVSADVSIPPSAAANANALLHKFPNYVTLSLTGDTKTMIKNYLSENKAVAVGYDVFASFMTNQVANLGINTIMPIPSAAELSKEPYGGHESLFVGYDETKGLQVKNSWSTNWGDAGYYWMPWDFYTGSGPYGPFISQLCLIPGVSVPVPITPAPPNPNDSSTLTALVKQMFAGLTNLQSDMLNLQLMLNLTLSLQVEQKNGNKDHREVDTKLVQDTTNRDDYPRYVNVSSQAACDYQRSVVTEHAGMVL